MPTYYFSTTDGNDTRTATQAQNQATPWKTLAKLNSYAFAPGDQVLLKRGDTFAGSLSTVSGDTGNPVTYGAYGPATDPPLISGFSLLTSWTLSSGHIYWAPLDVPRLQVVLVDGNLRGMGRYPNSGFLQYTTHSGAAWIAGSAVSSIPFDPTGGEAVVAKERYYRDRQRVVSRVGNTLNLDYTDFTNGQNNQNATNLNGFFIQDHIATLDTDGDWFYNKTEKRLYMYFSGTPSGRNIQAATFTVGIAANGRANFSILGLKVIGFNNSGINHDYSGPATINDNVIQYIGAAGIAGLQGPGGITINNNNISDCLNGGISHYDVSNNTISNNVINNIHMIMGMGESGDACGNGIIFFGNNYNVTRNKLTNIGFNGIAWYAGSNVLIEENLIDGYCMNKDDGGAIYTYGIDNPTALTLTNRIVRRNITRNGPGSLDGLGAYVNGQNFGFAFGVYLDMYSTNVLVEDNVLLEGCAGGVFINLYGSNTINNNLIFSGKFGIAINNQGAVRNLVITNNQVIMKTADQLALMIDSYNGTQDVVNFGTFDNNYYTRPINNLPTIQVGNGAGIVNLYSISQFFTAFGKDQNSKTALLSTDSISKFRTDINFSGVPASVTLDGIYKDIENTTYEGSQTIDAFGGSVLIYDSPLVDTTPKVKKLLTRNGNLLTENGRILYRMV